MSETRKDFIGDHIKRTSPEDKVQDLMKWMKAIDEKMAHEVRS